MRWIFAVLALCACGNECEEQPPLIELQVSGSLDPENTAMVALRRGEGEWSNVICDPQGVSVATSTPMWESSCDIIPLQLGAIPEFDSLEVVVISADGDLGGAPIQLGENSCEQQPMPFSVKTEPMLADDDSTLCTDYCEQRITCGWDGSLDSCWQGCLATVGSSPCPGAQRAYRACEVHASCESLGVGVCADFELKVSACEGGGG